MSKSKSEKATPTARRYDDAARAKIIAFLKKGNSNRAAKAEFGCTAHFAGKLRTEAGIAPTEPVVGKKVAVKKAAPVKGKAPVKPVVKAAVKAKAKPVAATNDLL